MKAFNISLLIIVLLSVACREEEPTRQPVGSTGSGGWSIPSNQILDGGPGKDGIPALLDPEFIVADEVIMLPDDELVVGVVIGNEARAYSHQVLDWHEIVNDQIGNTLFALTYCPLTGTAINWSRYIDDGFTTFGVSGLLYNSNLIPYDRKTDSNWSQMLNQSVEGSLIGFSPDLIPSFETTWGTWKKMYPNTKVISTDTGFDRPYGTYPYMSPANLDYRVDGFLIFPVTNLDDRLRRKERVLGVHRGDDTFAYRFEDFEGGITIQTDEIGTTPIVVVGSEPDNFLTTFQSSLGDTNLQFTPLGSDELPNIMTDQLGNTWNIFGEAVSGPNQEEQLIQPTSYIGYWFAWAAFNPDIEIRDF